MPGCVLRVSGSAFDVDKFLEESDLEPTVVYRKGQRRRPASRGTQTASGFNLTVSDSDDVREQVKEALKFLKGNREELLRLLRFKGVKGATLDFSSLQREFLTRSIHLPTELLSAAGAYGIDIEVSFYLSS